METKIVIIKKSNLDGRGSALSQIERYIRSSNNNVCGYNPFIKKEYNSTYHVELDLD